MLALFSALAARMRRGPAAGGEEDAVFRNELASHAGADLLRRKRLKVAIFAIGFGIFSAAIDLPLPAEDFYRAVRAELRSRPAPQDIAMIAVDDKTLNALNGELPNRIHESRIIERLASLGVERIAFDRAHAADETAEANQRFAEALARYPGKVWLGMVPRHGTTFQSFDEVIPLPEFRRHAPMAAMNGQGSPFGLSIVFPTRVQRGAHSHASLSATLAEYAGPALRYRPISPSIRAPSRPSAISTFWKAGSRAVLSRART